MTYGPLMVGRFVVPEPVLLPEKPGQLDISGQASSPPSTRAEVYALAADLTALAGLDSVIPLTFPDHPERDGYYSISARSGGLVDRGHNELVSLDWKLTLTRYGGAGYVDLESRLVPAARANAAAAVGTHWHAPNVGALDYDTAETAPLATVRTSQDGALTVYTAVPTNVAPRWHSAPADYPLGRARVLDAGREASGERDVDPGEWELSNGLVQVSPLTSGGSLEVATYDGAAWRAKSYTLAVGGDQLGPVWDSATILRNDMEAVALRLTAGRPVAGIGRVALDLALARGSRFVDIHTTTGAAGAWTVDRAASEAGAGTTGYRSAAAPDANGIVYQIGSTVAFTAAANGGLVTSASAQTFSGFIGAVLGATPPPGDTLAALMAQYVGAPAETVGTVRR